MIVPLRETDFTIIIDFPKSQCQLIIKSINVNKKEFTKSVVGVVP